VRSSRSAPVCCVLTTDYFPLTARTRLTPCSSITNLEWLHAPRSGFRNPKSKIGNPKWMAPHRPPGPLPGSESGHQSGHLLKPSMDYVTDLLSGYVPGYLSRREAGNLTGPLPGSLSGRLSDSVPGHLSSPHSGASLRYEPGLLPGSLSGIEPSSVLEPLLVAIFCPNAASRYTVLREPCAVFAHSGTRALPTRLLHSAF
jgi:hypothetical protein